MTWLGVLGIEADSPFFRYSTVTELRLRLNSSLLLWCYYGCIFLLFLPGFLSLLFSFPPFISYSDILVYFLFFLLLFFPVSLNIFALERQHSMLDYMAMSLPRFKLIFYSRVVANAFLMILPLLIGFFGTFLFGLDIRNDPGSLLLSLFYLPLVSLFLLFWYLLSSLILSICELRFPSSMVRVVFYYFALLALIFIFYFVDVLIAPFPIIEVFFGSILFTNLLLSFILLLISCLIVILLLSEVLNNLMESVSQYVTAGNHNVIPSGSSLSVEFSSFLEWVKSSQFVKWQYSLPLLNSIPYIFLYILSPNTSAIVPLVVLLFCFHFVFLLLSVFLIVFPSVSAEKEYRMEEMLLSRMSAYQYFFDKLWMLLKPLFLNLFVVVSAVIVFFRPDSSIFFPLLVNFLFRSLYFISILLFIWRLFPAKDLLQSAFLTIFGLEILGYMVSSFLFPDGEIFLIVFSPILSSLILFGVISDPNAADVLYIVTMFSLALSCIFLLASVVLIKSEIRYE